MSLISIEQPSQRPCRNDWSRFLAAWRRAPLRTGAIAPSSPALAERMVFCAALRPGMRVVELGPGTGVVTEAILAAGVRQEDLVLVEADKDFAGLLAQRYPGAKTVCGDAFSAIERLVDAGGRADAVVSSLPLFVYPRPMRTALCCNALALVGPHGRMVQFTYSPVSPVKPSPGIRAVNSRRIWRNLPPATVWTYRAETL
ncbi:class I SAM-dependent methyltransferase [Nitratireductor luteus]|uniref:class I SAM-dependent methyltransferase n=1 Tax=Nitratireductor luteus TaxID=2976980 RepID=UPI00223EBA1D|nr:rRNA adenine N-6-methyltransferase family protein [Nitratireductor luteus]